MRCKHCGADILTPDARAQRALTRTQFVVQMILAYAEIYPGIRTKDAMESAALTYKRFIRDEKIEFGDARYAWDSAAAARTLVKEYEGIPSTERQP